MPPFTSIFLYPYVLSPSNHSSQLVYLDSISFFFLACYPELSDSNSRPYIKFIYSGMTRINGLLFQLYKDSHNTYAFFFQIHLFSNDFSKCFIFNYTSDQLGLAPNLGPSWLNHCHSEPIVTEHLFVFVCELRKMSQQHSKCLSSCCIVYNVYSSVSIFSNPIP